MPMYSRYLCFEYRSAMSNIFHCLTTRTVDVLHYSIDIIDYITGIGKSSREHYKRTGNLCRYHGAGMVGVLKLDSTGYQITDSTGLME